MQSRIELEQSIHDVINELMYCASLLSDVHPKFEKFSTAAIKVINNHIADMEALLELCHDNLDTDDHDIRVLVEEVFVDTLKMLAQTLELAGTLIEYTIKLKDSV